MHAQIIALLASLSFAVAAPTSNVLERSTAVTSCTAPYTAKCCTSIDNVVLVTIPLALGIGCKTLTSAGCSAKQVCCENGSNISPVISGDICPITLT